MWSGVGRGRGRNAGSTASDPRTENEPRVKQEEINNDTGARPTGPYDRGGLRGPTKGPTSSPETTTANTPHTHTYMNTQMGKLAIRHATDARASCASTAAARLIGPTLTSSPRHSVTRSAQRGQTTAAESVSSSSRRLAARRAPELARRGYTRAPTSRGGALRGRRRLASTTCRGLRARTDDFRGVVRKPTLRQSSGTTMYVSWRCATLGNHAN